MAKAIFHIIKTGKAVECTFDGAVFTEAIDLKKRKYKVNVPDPEAYLVQHLPE